MKMENIFLEEFRKFTFTRNQKKIANYFMNHQFEISQKTLRETAAEAGVSEVSILNFVRKLGFDGFSTFKNWVHEQITQQIHPTYAGLDERFRGNRESRTSQNLLIDHLRMELHNVQQSLEQNPPDAYEKAADALTNSDRIFVVGLGSVEGLANRFARALYYLFDNVSFLSGYYNGLVQALSRIKKGDTVLLLCFSRYYKTDIALCSMIHELGANLILISDSAVSPIAVYADHLLAATTGSISFHHSMAGLLAILEYLIVLLTERTGADVKSYWDQIDHYTEDFRFR